jgi:hypothetical protein
MFSSDNKATRPIRRLGNVRYKAARILWIVQVNAHPSSNATELLLVPGESLNPRNIPHTRPETSLKLN